MSPRPFVGGSHDPSMPRWSQHVACQRAVRMRTDGSTLVTASLVRLERIMSNQAGGLSRSLDFPTRGLNASASLNQQGQGTLGRCRARSSGTVTREPLRSIFACALGKLSSDDRHSVPRRTVPYPVTRWSGEGLAEIFSGVRNGPCASSQGFERALNVVQESTGCDMHFSICNVLPARLLVPKLAR